MQRRKVIFAGVGTIGAIACGHQKKSPSGQLFEPLASAPAETIAGNSDRLVNPSQYLKLLKPPVFKQGHKLPPLSRFGWTLSFAMRVELADRWGYTLEWGGYLTPERLVAVMSAPQSDEARVMALAASQPDRYQLSIILNRDLPTSPAAIWLRNDRGELVDGKNTWSPEAPDAALQAMAELRAKPLAQIRKIAPIAVVLNGGEHGLGVPDSVERFGDRDPKVSLARKNRDWFEYISERKAYQESFVTQAVRQAVPDRRVYVYYPADSNPHKDRYGGWKKWCYDYKYMRSISDYPSGSTYFKEFNSGWTGDMDILTEVLNSIGQQIKFGDPLSYNWVCSGWMRGKNPVFGEIDRYMGFLKCYYMAGTIGGIAGYFDYPTGGFEAYFPANNPPNWLQQMTVLARVHGLFSHLENYLRQGDLLPGPAKHRWSKDTPAYEFPTEDPDIRVLARKDRKKLKWLIVAWSAGGTLRQVSVKIPLLGTVSLFARPTGSIYEAEIVANQPKLNWVDRPKV
jgi:hypothetical protein